MNTLIAVAISLLTFAACAGCGRLAGKLWRGKWDCSTERFVIDTALGAGVMSLVLFVLGIAQLFTRPVVMVALVLPVTALIVLMVRRSRPDSPEAVEDGVDTDHWRHVGSVVPVVRGNRRDLSPCRILCWLLFAVLLLAVLIPAAAPPTMSDWDSLAYHLAVPKLYVEHGGIYNITIMSHANFPFLIDLLYVPAVMLNMPEAARILNVFFSALLIALIALIAARHFHPKAATLAALGIAGMPIVLFLATTAYIDLATALYTVLGIHFLLNYLDTREHRYIVGSAIAAGFAASTKMTGLAAIPLILAWLLVDRFVTVRRLEWKPAMLFALVASVVCSPWYIKSIIYTGSPVYPFFYGVFGGRGWSAELASHYTYQQSLFGMGHDFGMLLMLPWNLAFHSAAFYDRPGLFVGPLFLIAVPLLFVAKYNCRKLIGLLGFFAAYLGIWFGLTHQSRYLIPGFAVLSIIVAAVAYADERFKAARAALGVVLVLTAAFGVITLWPAIVHSAPVVFGFETRESFLNRSLDVYPAQQFMNRHLPADARVAFLGDTRGYYLDRDYVWADWGHSLEFSRRYSSAEEMAGYLKSRGITHVMINHGFFAKREKDTEPYYSAMESGVFEEIYPLNGFRNRVVVCKIN